MPLIDRLLRHTKLRDTGFEQGQEDSSQMSKDNLYPDGFAWGLNFRWRRRDYLTLISK
jgi:hypothetical protein